MCCSGKHAADTPGPHVEKHTQWQLSRGRGSFVNSIVKSPVAHFWHLAMLPLSGAWSLKAILPIFKNRLATSLERKGWLFHWSMGITGEGNLRREGFELELAVRCLKHRRDLRSKHKHSFLLLNFTVQRRNDCRNTFLVVAHLSRTPWT